MTKLEVKPNHFNILNCKKIKRKGCRFPKNLIFLSITFLLICSSPIMNIVHLLITDH